MNSNQSEPQPDQDPVVPQAVAAAMAGTDPTPRKQRREFWINLVILVTFLFSVLTAGLGISNYFGLGHQSSCAKTLAAQTRAVASDDRTAVDDLINEIFTGHGAASAKAAYKHYRNRRANNEKVRQRAYDKASKDGC